MKFSSLTKLLFISAAVITTLMDPSNMTNAMVDKELNQRAAEPVDQNSWGGAWIIQASHDTIDEVKVKAAGLVKKYSVEEQNNFKILHRIGDENGLNFVVVEGISLKDIKSIPGVLSVTPDSLVYAGSYSWGIDRSDQEDLPVDNSAYSPAFTGCGVDVYVLDTGLDTGHVEFTPTGNGRVVDNIWNGYGPITDNTDVHGHGSHCAGTVGGNTIGIATCANIHGMKILSDAGSGSTSGILLAMAEVKRIHLANPGAKSVLSMSLGATCTGSCSDDAMVKYIGELADAGIITSVAAGNSNQDANRHTPAAAPEAFTVGSTTRDSAGTSDRKSSFSNFGNLVDFLAPGSDITSVRPGGGYWTISGTSMACPHVTGVVAQNLEKAGTLVNMINRNAINQVQTSMECDTAKDKVGGFNSDTINDILQVPKDDGKWNCISTATDAPTMQPSGPSAAPSAIPTVAPSEVPEVPASFAPYSTSDTEFCTKNTVDEDIFVCPGYDLTFELCDGNSCSGSVTGDTFLRLFNGMGQEIQENDDSCGLCSSITHTFTEACQTYQLRQGCYGGSACSGTVTITINAEDSSDSPTVQPTVDSSSTPTVMPVATNAPISSPVGAPSGPLIPSSCPAFTASNTNSADNDNAVACPVTVCPGTELTFETCSEVGKSCNGDTFMRLKNAQGDTLDLNDDNCGFCSRVSFEFTAQCQEYYLMQGCYANGTCSGTTEIITHGTSQAPVPEPTEDPMEEPTEDPTEDPSVPPTRDPTEDPSVPPTEYPTEDPSVPPTGDPTEDPSVPPTGEPTEDPSVPPTGDPTEDPTVVLPSCAAFQVQGTDSANQNTADCEMTVCPGTMLTMETCADDGKTCGGDTVLRLVGESGSTEIDMNDDRCGLCSSISYEFTESCQTYKLKQGCYGDSSCVGQTRIRFATLQQVNNYKMLKQLLAAQGGSDARKRKLMEEEVRMQRE